MTNRFKGLNRPAGAIFYFIDKEYQKRISG